MIVGSRRKTATSGMTAQMGILEKCSVILLRKGKKRLGVISDIGGSDGNCYFKIM
jgi:hypothetical protein